MSLYGDYIREREGKQIVENDFGFATYQFVDKDKCYIEDIYVAPSHRRQRVGKDLADKVAEIALESGCKKLIGSVKPSTYGSTESIKALIWYGFKLLFCEQDMIYLEKEL